MDRSAIPLIIFMLFKDECYHIFHFLIKYAQWTQVFTLKVFQKNGLVGDEIDEIEDRAFKIK